MIHITFHNYKRETRILKTMIDQVRATNENLLQEQEQNKERLAQAKRQHEYDSDKIRDLNLKAGDLMMRNEDLSERLEKEQSDNCELQNLYSEKCKVCEEYAGKIDSLILTNASLALKVEGYEREGYIIVNKEEYDQLKADADKYRADRERHNSNRRKRRAAKKVAHAKPE